MVADKVDVLTRTAKGASDEATLWSSSGEESYQLKSAEKKTRGTEITIFLNDENKEFAENQLMEIAQYFIPKILNTTKTTKEIFEECEPKERHDKFLELFQVVAQKWMNEELDLSKPGFEGFSVFRSRITNVLKVMQESLTDKSNIMVVTSGGAISGVYAEVIECSHEEIQKLNFGIKNVSISEFLMTTERFTLKAFNSSLIPEELETFI